jgi:nucleotide-binding universal stress UspA family protein
MFSQGPYKKIVLACSLEENGAQVFQKLNEFNWTGATVFHLVHIFKVQVMVNDFTPFIYPDEGQQSSIEDLVLSQLKASRERWSMQGKTSVEKCFFDTNPKKKLVDYLSEVQADLVVLTSHQKEGLDGVFSSGFSEYLLRHSPCDVLVLRSK